jgi:hypothetical protein
MKTIVRAACPSLLDSAFFMKPCGKYIRMWFSVHDSIRRVFIND